VTDSLAVGNSVTIGTDISIGIASEGLSLGVSQSFSQSWSTTRTSSAAQSIAVTPGQARSIKLSKRFFVAEGRVRINYGKTKGGHYVWYAPPSARLLLFARLAGTLNNLLSIPQVLALADDLHARPVLVRCLLVQRARLPGERARQGRLVLRRRRVGGRPGWVQAGIHVQALIGASCGLRFPFASNSSL
jgi:hypothetical protein